MSAYRCRYCEIKWPGAEEFRTCPQCREPSVLAHVNPEMDEEEGWSRKVDADFGWWLLDQWLDPAK